MYDSSHSAPGSVTSLIVRRKMTALNLGISVFLRASISSAQVLLTAPSRSAVDRDICWTQQEIGLRSRLGANLLNGSAIGSFRSHAYIVGLDSTERNQKDRGPLSGAPTVLAMPRLARPRPAMPSLAAPRRAPPRHALPRLARASLAGQIDYSFFPVAERLAPVPIRLPGCAAGRQAQPRSYPGRFPRRHPAGQEVLPR